MKAIQVVPGATRPTTAPEETAGPRHRGAVIGALRRAGALAGAGIGIYLIMALLLRPWYSTWGTTDAELTAPLPGDDLVPKARTQWTNAVTIDAPPEAVWPWLVQMGVDRAGLYTYTWIENGLLRLGVTNADRIVPEWQHLAVGDIIAYTPEEYPTGRTGPYVATLEPNRALVLCNGKQGEPCPGTMQIVLNSQPDGATRLIVRNRSSADTPLLATLPDRILEPGYFVMQRGMMLGIKERAERTGR